MVWMKDAEYNPYYSYDR